MPTTKRKKGGHFCPPLLRLYEVLFLAVTFAALGDQYAIRLLFKALHAGLSTGGGFDGFRLALPCELDDVALRRSLERLRTIEVSDLDRILIALFRDVKISAALTRPASDECVGLRSSSCGNWTARWGRDR